MALLALPVRGSRVIGGGGRALVAFGRAGFCRLPVGAQERLLGNPGLFGDFSTRLFPGTPTPNLPGALGFGLGTLLSPQEVLR